MRYLESKCVVRWIAFEVAQRMVTIVGSKIGALVFFSHQLQPNDSSCEVNSRRQVTCAYAGIRYVMKINHLETLFYLYVNSTVTLIRYSG